jgi:peptide-methionine (R)-S-oxide reductase
VQHLAIVGAVAVVFACARFGDAQQPPASRHAPPLRPAPAASERVHVSEAEWRTRLTAEQFEILREHGTEPPFHNAYWNNHTRGTYYCAGCGAPLFASNDKFDSGTGWPSFTRMIEPGRVESENDGSHGMIRTEVHCARCGGHLGHLFDDGPPPTGNRFCIDSASLWFEPG